MQKTKQNADLTFKYNMDMGRHGWLRLTPAYSVKMVGQILSGLNYKPVGVLEPFSGTGTTELVCANQGINSYAFDVNPFLVWLATTKTEIYSEQTLNNFEKTYLEIAVSFNQYITSELPPIYNIERWWNKTQLDFLSRLKTAIWNVNDLNVKNLLKIAFCRLIISVSNASFNHVSTSFKDSTEDNSFTPDIGRDLFLSYCKMIRATAAIQPKTTTNIFAHDAMVAHHMAVGNYDTVITSPPYPNRISYIRELRPYMYWLDYLKTADDASNLDWGTIGGTWGAATSKLSTWKKESHILPNYLFEIADGISKAENKSAGLMANYVLKYFDDMAIHFKAIYDGILPNGTVHYIVGNSNFYGYSVPSDQLYIDLLSRVGFKNAKANIVRKRNCNKALFEYWISASK